MNLPTLYKKNGNGSIQEWTIHAEGNTIVTRWGVVGGTIQEARDIIAKGKNVGKKNETTPAQQAELEAASQHEKKLKKGYVITLVGAEAGEVDALITGGVSPMLAHRFDEQGHKLKYPCYAQPKFDGHRCIAVVDEAGKCTLWSRTRKPITSMDHIVAAIEARDLCNMVLDGELYNHEYRHKFEELTSFIRDTKAKPGAEVVEYHIYDIIETDLEFEVRTDDLRSLFENEPDDSPLKEVETVFVKDEDELTLAFDRWLAEGYEGAMARNAEGKYVNKRSYDLLKLKEFADAEFKIVGVEEGRGKLAGHAIFVCVAGGDEVPFRAKMKGPQESLKPYFEHPETAIGRMLTVKYQGLTGKNKVPRFPVALRFAENV